jgi:hypothetical protein
MATEEAVRCDVCDILKREVNRWWKVKQMSDHIRVYKAEEQADQPRKDVCGQSCLHRLVDRWMETGSLEKPEVVHPVEG